MSGPAGEAEAILTRIEQSSGRPLRAMIEISDRCNEVCVHCYQEQGQKGEMSTEQVKAVLDELAELGVLFLTVAGGEATLRKDFLEIMAHARKCGFALTLFTNGLTMTEELARKLKDLSVHVVEISLYSHRAEVHDFVTGVPGSFDKTLAGIRHLVALGVDVHIKSNVMSVNEDDLDGYIELAQSLGTTYAFDPGHLMPREGGNRASEMWSRSANGHMRVLRDKRLMPTPIAPRAPKPLTASLCGAGESVHIEPNGELHPCTMLDVSLGSVTDGGLRPSRESNATRQGMVSLRWSDVHGCRDCDLGAYCGRCHASALAEVGDALAPYPSACASARDVYEVACGEGPRIAASAGRDSSLGPYRSLADHAFEVIDDVVTASDDALAASLGWVRTSARRRPAPAAARPGELVQIRRPGKGKPKLMRIPGGDASLSAEQDRAVRTSWAATREATT